MNKNFRKNYNRKILKLFVCAVILVTTIAPVYAEEAKQRVVRIACGMNDLLYLDDNNDPAGIGLPYIRQIAWNNNWSLEYVTGSYNESLQRLYNGEIDLMLPIGADEDPDGLLAYSRFNIGFQQIGLFAKSDADIYYDDFKTFQDKKVGLSVGANSRILDNFAKKNGFTYKKVSINTTKNKVDALMNGEVDMIAFSTLNSVQGGKLVAILEQVPYYLCTSINNKEIIEGINGGMSKILVETPEISTELYQSTLTGNTPLSYTREEHNKIEKTDKVVFGVYNDRLPLAGRNSKGELTGIYVSLLKEIEKISGLNIEIKSIPNSNELYENIDNGNVDFVIGIQKLRFSQKNADKHLSSNNITECTVGAVTKSGFEPNENNVKKIALTHDRVYLEANIKEWFPNALIVYYNQRRECLDAISNASVDLTFLNDWEFNYEKKNAYYSNLTEWGTYHLESGITLGGSRQSDLELLSILEKTVGKIDQNKITDIVSENLNNSYDTYTLMDRLYAVRIPLIIVSCFLLLIAIGFSIYVKSRRKYIKDLEEANKAKTEFLSRMSHEMRTPLNAIDGYATVMEEVIDASNEDGQKNIENIHRSVQCQLSIVNDLLDIQQLEEGRLKLHPTDIIINEFMDNIITMIKPEIEEKHLIFHYERKTQAVNSYLIDGGRFQQVLLNLLHNAIKFTPEGGNITITGELLEKREEYNILKFVISDTGIGMSEDFQKNYLFKRFAQEYKGNTSPYEGCGIGLEISREIIRLMGGDITCVSKKNEGSTFTVTLQARHSLKKVKRKKKEYQELDLSGMRILLCEDNKMNQDIECRLIQKMHCEVDVVDDGAIGLEKFINSPSGSYALVLMDIRMPNMNGWECTEKIRHSKHPDALSIPIFALSANTSEEDILMSKKVGMNEHLSKPLDIRVLYEKIKKYIEKG